MEGVQLPNDQVLVLVKRKVSKKQQQSNLIFSKFNILANFKLVLPTA